MNRGLVARAVAILAAIVLGGFGGPAFAGGIDHAAEENGEIDDEESED